jgi:S1-C subfamily serine protease
LKHLLAILAAISLSACSSIDKVDIESRAIAIDQNAEPAGAAGQVAAQSVAQLSPKTSPTYVTMTVSQNDTNSLATNTKTALTSGSGFLVSNNGYVMTAAHVAVAKGNLVSARAANGRVYEGLVVAINPGNDMAVIKLRAYEGRSVEPGTPACMLKGDLVYTLGKPHGGGDTARIGSFEAKHFARKVTYGKFGYPDAIVLHMGTQKGESGGPVFNNRGQLIGMVVSTLSDTNGKSINLAHAIPTPTLANFLCSATSCSASWSGLSAKNVDTCDKVTALFQ